MSVISLIPEAKITQDCSSSPPPHQLFLFFSPAAPTKGSSQTLSCTAAKKHISGIFGPSPQICHFSHNRRKGAGVNHHSSIDNVFGGDTLISTSWGLVGQRDLLSLNHCLAGISKIPTLNVIHVSHVAWEPRRDDHSFPRHIPETLAPFAFSSCWQLVLSKTYTIY